MKRLRIIFLACFLFFFSFHLAKAQALPERKIVVFKPEISLETQLNLLTEHRAEIGKNLRLVNGVVARLSRLEAEKLARDSRILRIDPDVEVYAVGICDRYPNWPGCRKTPTPTPKPTSTPKPTPTPTPTSSSQPQPILWNLTKIAAPEAWNISSGSGVRVAVVDTGIDTDHPDLKNNLAACVNFIQSWRTCEDDNGHGTHVSGIIAAENNTIGIVGVAPQAKIAALKVLDRNGSGYLSDIIEALDWAVSNNVKVVNMSLGTNTNVLSLEEAVRRVNQVGIIQVAAAGNSGPGENTIIYPARYPEVIAVAASDANNNIPSWSSRGLELDLTAPGAEINSTYLNGKYKVLSGTSMAAPHVVGVVALRLAIRSGETPAQIDSILKSTANLLPFDPLVVGAGLVNAYQFVTAP